MPRDGIKEVCQQYWFHCKHKRTYLSVEIGVGGGTVSGQQQDIFSGQRQIRQADDVDYLFCLTIGFFATLVKVSTRSHMLPPHRFCGQGL